MERPKHTKTVTNILLACSFLLGFLASAAQAKPASVLLQEGLYAEEIDGDLDAAIRIYEQVIAQAEAAQQTAAQATFRIGMCHLKRGEKQKAAEYFRDVISKYPKQEPLAAKAREQLSRIRTVEDIIADSFVIHYRTVDPAKDGLTEFNKNHPRGVRTHHAGRYRQNGQTINTICTDTEAGKDKIVSMLNSRDDLVLIKVVPPKSAAPAGFGPVIERVIYQGGSAHECLIDFETGKLFKVPEPLRDHSEEQTEQVWEWVNATGVDAAGDTGGALTSQGLQGFQDDMVAAPAPEGWRESPEVLVAMMKPLRADGKARMFAKLKLPTTYYFKTREGNMGVLQILGFTEGEPRGVRFRYKMLQEPYTQKFYADIGPDGTFNFETTVRMVNESGSPVKTTSFVNSDFVKVTAMHDGRGRPIQFTTAHQGDHWRYHVTFNEPVAPGGMMVYSHEGTMTGLIKTVPGEKDTFRFYMRHYPSAGRPTLRIETYLLPEGAELLSTTPADMQRREKDGRIELHVEETIPPGGSITTAFKYRLPGAELSWRLEELSASKNKRAERVAENRAEMNRDIEAVLKLDKPKVVSDRDKRASENLAAEGWRLWQQRKLPEAEQKFKEALEKDPMNANAWNGLGWSQSNQGKPLNAKVSFEKCLEIEPTHAAALNGLGWIAKGEGTTDDAIGYWQKAVAATPTATAALNGLAVTCMERKEYDEAIKYYEMWLKAEPDNADAKEGLKKAKAAKNE